MSHFCYDQSMCLFETEWVRVCVCVRERERKRVRERDIEREREMHKLVKLLNTHNFRSNLFKFFDQFIRS